MNWFNTFSAFIYYSLVLTSQTNGVSAQNIHSVNITRSDNFDSGDKVNLVVVNSSLCQDQNAINAELSAANCTLLAQGTVEFGDNSCYMECVCKNETGSFILHEQKCGDENKLRQGRCTNKSIFYFFHSTEKSSTTPFCILVGGNINNR